MNRDTLDSRVVFGRGTSGKSFLVRHWLRSFKGRVIIHDVACEPAYADLASVVAWSRADLVRAAQSRARRIVFRGLGDGDWELLNEVAWALGNVTVVWEEVDTWWPPGQRPTHAFRLVNQGRHRGVRLIGCARRPARVSRDFTANASRIVIFPTTEPGDLRYLREMAGDDARRAAQLAPYHALDWTREGGAVEKKSPFR